MNTSQLKPSTSNQLFVILSDEEHEEVQLEEETKKNQKGKTENLRWGKTVDEEIEDIIRQHNRRHSHAQEPKNWKSNQLYEKYKCNSPFQMKSIKQIFTNKLSYKIQNAEENTKQTKLAILQQKKEIKKLIQSNIYQQALLHKNYIEKKNQTQDQQALQQYFKQEKNKLQVQLISLLKQLKKDETSESNNSFNNKYVTSKSLSHQAS